MKDYQDAHGHAMYDYLKGKRFSEIVERDDGYFEVSNGPGVYFSSYKTWPVHQKKALRYVKARVLDIGCGAGRHSLYLQKKGFEVLGTDLSPLAIKVCKSRGLKKAKVLPITRLSYKIGRFDTIIMLGNNFGLFGSFKQAKRLLRRFKRITNEKALIIAEVLDPYQTKDPNHLEYQKLNRKRGRMSGQVRIRVRHRKYVTPWFDYLFVSKKELQEILNGTGWAIKHFVDSKGPVYIVIIEKE